jgi:outer membrane transport energization protein ExbD (TC 2.C.1.1.1)
MSMNVGQEGGDGSGDPEVMVDVNTTPLIDVMLVLLIMLILTIPIQMNAVNMDMPASNPPPVSQPPPVDNLEIDFDGTYIWNGDVLPNLKALEARLRAESMQPVQPELHIRPNKLVDYKYVAAAMAAAQRLGIKQMGLVGNEQFLHE